MLLLVASCTAANPDFTKVTSSDVGQDGSSDGSPGSGGAPRLDAGAGGFGGFPYGTGGDTDASDTGADGTGAMGGVVAGTGGGGGSSGVVPDAGSPTGTGGSTPPVDGAASDAATPVIDLGADSTSPPVDTTPPVDNAPRPPDAVVVDTGVDAVVAPPDTGTSPADAMTTPDAATTPDANPSTTNGLKADYFNGQNFETYVFTRTDQQVSFNWVSSGPDPRLGADNFSVRWTGFVEPRYTGTYTFSTVTDDGVRLWIDGVNFIDKWSTQSGVEHTAIIDLVANRRYPIRMEFFDRAFTASAQLFWKSTQQAKEIVPYTRLWTP